MEKPHIVRGQRVAPVKMRRSRELRRAMTEAERILWARIRGGQLYGLRFRRQQVIQGFIVDFYCHEAQLVVEIDGSGHAGQADYDAKRDEALSAMGLRTLRIENEDVFLRPEATLALIATHLR